MSLIDSSSLDVSEPSCGPRPIGRRRALRLLGALCCAATASCTVGFWDYQQIQAPDAEYLHVGCNGNGPPSLAYYPFHGIFISVAVSPLQLGLHVPHDLPARLNEDTVVVSGRRSAGAALTTLTLHLKPVQQLPPPPPTGLEIQKYDERHDASAEPGAAGADDTIDRMTRGTLRLPPITIGGITYPPQELPFEHRSYQHLMGVTASCASPQ